MLNQSCVKINVFTFDIKSPIKSKSHGITLCSVCSAESLENAVFYILIGKVQLHINVIPKNV